MAAVQLTGAVWPGYRTARLGPYQDGSGNLWVVALLATNNFQAWKSSDSGSTWGTTFATSTGTINITCCDSVFDSTNGVIYVVGENTTGSTLMIWKFTIATTTWAQVSTGTGPAVQGDVNGFFPALLSRRSDGSFVVVYQGPTASNMGTSYRQMYYVTCTSAGTWGTGTLADGQSGISLHINCKCAVVGASDRTHMLSGGAAAAGQLRHVSLSSANALDTAAGFGTDVEANYYTAYYDATLAKVVVGPHSAAAHTPLRATSGANPTFTADTNAVGSDTQASCPAAFFYDTGGAKLYAFFRDSSSGDVYVNSTASTTWTTANAALQDTATAPNGISVGAVTNAIGVIFNDSGVFYDSHSLVALAPLLSGQVKHRTPRVTPARLSRGRF